ncbi:MAG: helix-hairpin-helix domain-containing protein [Deltaproteobacteria bacterium]|nr:helix-hairpin-helix domain-containing protein [Deltaproteobacteria bacterium]
MFSRVDRRLAAGLLVLGAAWTGAVLDHFERRRAESGPAGWEAPRSYAGAVEIAGAVSRPGVRPGLAGRTLREALALAGPLRSLRGPDLDRPLEEGARVVLHPDGRVRAGRMPGRRLLALGLPIPLEFATAADLVALPGVGPAIAARIIAHRDAGAPLKRIADLDAVPGIGPKTLARIRPHLTLQPACHSKERGFACHCEEGREAPTKQSPPPSRP